VCVEKRFHCEENGTEERKEKKQEMERQRCEGSSIGIVMWLRKEYTNQ
jgi:hypothetical protein